MSHPTPSNRAGLNFWQIVGLVLIVVGVGYLMYRESKSKPATPGSPPMNVAPTP